MPAESLKTEKPELGRADTSSELLIQLALTRRGITFEMSNLLSFSLHGRWVERIMERGSTQCLLHITCRRWPNCKLQTASYFKFWQTRVRQGYKLQYLGGLLTLCLRPRRYQPKLLICRSRFQRLLLQEGARKRGQGLTLRRLLLSEVAKDASRAARERMLFVR